MRIFSLYRPLEWRIFLCLSIVLGLLAFPLRVLSQEEDLSQYIHLNKTVKEYDYATKKGTLSLEAFVEGEITSHTTTSSLEVALLIDLGNADGLAMAKTAGTAFVDFLHDNANLYNQDYKVGLITLCGDKKQTMVRKNLTSVTDSQDVQSLNNMITSLTYSESGNKADVENAMSLAQGMLSDVNDALKVVIYLTGAPGVNPGWGGKAIGKAKKLKDDGVLIYTIGLYPQEPTDTDLLHLLQYMSSNYPDATGLDSPGGSPVSDEYYHCAYTDVAMQAIFNAIRDKLVHTVITGGAKVILREDAYLQDVLTEYFSLLPGVADGGVRVYYSNCTGHQPGSTGYLFEGKYEITASVEISGTQTVQISGLDYSAYWCGYNASAGHAQGRKFIVEIPFYLTDFSASPLTLPTNTADSGIFGKFEGESAYTKKKAFTVPSITFANLSIQLTGLKAGDSSRFHVTSSAMNGYDLSLMLRGVDASGSVTTQDVYRLEPGTYTVTESFWPWKYTPQGQTSLSQDISVSPTFVFSLQEKQSLPMNDEATKRNQMHP